MPSVKDFIEGLDYEDLVKLRKDLKEYKGLHLSKLIEKRMRELEKEHEVYCATCSARLEPESTNNFTLIFGPESFRKKASFCGIDCLEFFLRKLKSMKKEVIKNENKKVH